MAPEDCQKLTRLKQAESLQTFGTESKCIPMSPTSQKIEVTDK